MAHVRVWPAVHPPEGAVLPVHHASLWLPRSPATSIDAPRDAIPKSLYGATAGLFPARVQLLSSFFQRCIYGLVAASWL